MIAPSSYAPAAASATGMSAAARPSEQATAAELLPAVPTAGAHKHLYAHHGTTGGAPSVLASTGGGSGAAAGAMGRGGQAVSHRGPMGDEDEDGESLLEELMLMLT